MLRYILLGFLSYRPMTGYELKTFMDTSTSHFWHAYHSQIYTTLRKLEEEGLLTSQQEDPADRLSKRIYTLTPAGRAELNDWLGKPLTEMPQVKEDLLVRVFFSGQRDAGAVLEELRYQRRLHQEKLAVYRKIDEHDMMPADPDLPEHAHKTMVREAQFWRATLHFGISYETMYLTWLDDVIAWLEGEREATLPLSA